MKHLSILVPLGQNNLSSIVGPYKIFHRANEYVQAKGRQAVFDIELVGSASSANFYDGLFTVHTQQHIDEVEKTDLLIIPSLNHSYEETLKGNQPLINWIGKQYKAGAEVVSICTGAFLLAATGVLAGKSCSTHWAAADSFRQYFPGVRLQSDQLITDEHGIYTNGGAYSFLNLIIYLIDKYYDRETALFCAKVFQVDIARSMQSEFSIFHGNKQHADEPILQAQTYIETHYQKRISFADLSDNLGLGRRNFDRRFKKATDYTPLEYQQRVKVEAAKKSFESSRKNVSEVMYEVGYSDSKAFRDIFIRITGLSPNEYKQKYNLLS